MNVAADLSPDLLYELLLTNIASQRGDHAAAVVSMSKAAHLSRDRRIVGRAITMAARIADHQRVVELSNLMTNIHPEESRHHLILANAQLATGHSDPALKILIDLARQQQSSGEAILQSIATMLATRPPEEQMLARFRRGIEAWPQSPALKLTAALLASELKQNEAFRALITEALELRPDWEIAAMLKLSDLAEFAVKQMPEYAEGFLRDFPDARQFRIHYGKMLQHSAQLKKAMAQFEIVLDEDPKSTAALLASGSVYLAQDNLPKALKRLSRLLMIDPHNDQARLYIADIKIERAEFDSAAMVLEEIISSDYYLDVAIRNALILAKQKGIAAGVRYLEEIQVDTEDDAVRVILGLGLLYENFDLPERAKQVFDAGLAKMPANPDLLYNRGLLAVQLNLLELHERDMRALIQQQPNNAHAYNSLGYTLADETERLDEALELITRALAIRPYDPYILDSMGWVHFRIGNNDKAIEYLRRALDAQKSAEIAAHLGEALWVAGAQREARKVWAQGKEWSPDNPVLLDTLKRLSAGHSSDAAATRVSAIARLRDVAPVRSYAPRTL